jgi:hypothetical protein
MDRDNRIWWGKDGNNTPRIKRFLAEVKQGVVPQTMWMNAEVGNTQEAKKEVVALFGSVNFMTPKPERLLHRVLTIATNPGDLVLDSFLGSGTTAAVAHKMGRRWIGVEMGARARSHCALRLTKVIEGEQGGISRTPAGPAAAASASSRSASRSSRRTARSTPRPASARSPATSGSPRPAARSPPSPAARSSASTASPALRSSTTASCATGARRAETR